MRNNDPIFWPDDTIDLGIRQKINKNYTDCINVSQTQWYEADLDQRSVMGDQDLWGLIFPGVSTNRRKIFNFNLTNRAIQMPSGYQRRNRKSTIAIPILSSGQRTADQITKCLFHVHKREVPQLHSDCFEQGALTKGLGWCYTYISKENDLVSGDIRKKYVDMAAVLTDPYWRKHDLSDCRFWWMREYLDREVAAIQNPDLEDYINSLPPGTYRDDKFFYMPEVYQIQFPNLMAMDQYWYKSSREATYIIDKKTEECQEWTGTEKQLKQLMQSRNEQGVEFKNLIAVQKRKKPTVRRTIIINDRAIKDEDDPNSIDRYPVSACLGYFNPNSPYYSYKFRGIARDLRDAQYLFNLRKVTDLDILQSQQQGLKVKKGALVTPDDSLNQGNGRVLTIDPAFQMSDVEPMQIIPPHPTMLQMEEQLKQIMMEISGVNEELLGSSDTNKDMAGILSMIRQSAALTTLQKLFDQFDEFQRLDSEIDVALIQQHWTVGKVRQVIGEDPTPEFENRLFFKYACKVVPAVLTESQQQLEAQQLIYARKELEMPISSKRILKALTIQDKDEIIAEVEEAEKQQAQMQEQRAKLEMDQIRVDNETKMSYANSQNSLAAERTEKIQLEKAESTERLKRAKEEELGALLNFVKSLKELHGMDIESIRQKVEILNMLKPQEEKIRNKENTV